MRFLLPYLVLFAAGLYGQSGAGLLERGHEHYDADRIDSARFYYRAAVSIDTADIQLRAYTSLIKLAINRSDHAAADSLAVEADRLLAQGVLPGTRLKYLRMKANGWSRNGEYRRALPALRRVAADQEAAGDPAAAETLADIALTYKRMQLPDSSLIYIERAHDAYRSNYDSTDVRLGYFYNQIGTVYYGADRLTEAERYYRLGIDRLRAGGEHRSERMGLLYNNLANVYADRGQFSEAFALRERAMDISRDLGLEEDYAIALFNLGVNHYMVGNFGAAVQYVDRAIAIREKLFGAGHPSLFNSYQARSILQSLSGDDRRAIHSYRRLIGLARADVGRDNELIGGYYGEMGLSHFNLGQLDSAVYYHRRAIRVFRTTSRQGTGALATALYNLSTALAERGDAAEALKTIGEAMRILRRLDRNDGLEYAQYLAAYAARQAAVGAEAEAVAALERAHELARPDGKYPLGTTTADVLELLSATSYTLYESFPSRANRERFQGFERDYLELAEATRSQFHDAYTKGILNDRTELFLRRAVDRNFAIYGKDRDPEFLARLYEYSEYGKGAAVRDQLRIKSTGFRGVPDSIPAALDSFQTRIEELYYLAQDPPPGRLDSVDRLLFTTRLAYDSLRLRVSERYPDFFGLIGPTPTLALPRVQAIAEEQGLSFVVYLRGEAEYLALVLTGGSAEVVRCGPVDAVDRAVATWRKDLSSTLTDDHRQSGRYLHALLWQPAEPYLNGERVVVVPDGQLHSVSFAALPAGESGYLVEQYTVSYAYALTLFGRQLAPAEETVPTGIVGVAPGFTDLAVDADTSRRQPGGQPFALQLVEKIGAVYRGAIFLGAEATEDKVRPALNDGNLLLFATHGYANRETPLQSGIQLRTNPAGSEDDGFLSVAEIFSRSIPADLTILGTCESGIGRLTPGEGMLSVAYAFSYAGCASTLNTLWPVDDQANAGLISGLIGELALGKDRAAALRAVQQRHLATAATDLRHPYYWGALALQGRSGPVTIDRAGAGTWWWLGGLGLAIAASGFLFSGLRRGPR